MGIRIRKQRWNRAAAEMDGIDAEQAASALMAQGFDVEIIDGDWGASYYADYDEEHAAVMALGE